MQPGEQLLIFGASVRAAAFSALRGGLVPWCVDLCADADLRHRCPAMRLPGKYPDSFSEVASGLGPGPWMYTGGLENHPVLVLELASRRPLWGNDANVLRRVRHPAFLRDTARAAGLPTPELAQPGHVPPNGRCLIKPLGSAGGRGVRVWSGDRSKVNWGFAYLQEQIEGVPVAALYVAAGGTALLLGLVRQLIGEPWLHAHEFGYCGSVGPLSLSATLARSLRRLGHRLAAEGGLGGLFGVDGILRDDAFWPVEINPRYTASIEVLEYATGLRALHLHRLAFEDEQEALSAPVATSAAGVVAKAVLFARQEVVFPAHGPWTPTLAVPKPVEEMPEFADLPNADDHIEPGRPVLTLLAKATDVAGAVAVLRQRAAEVQRHLYPE